MAKQTLCQNQIMRIQSDQGMRSHILIYNLKFQIL